MPDVFISYKKEERETAALLATRLTEAGYDVWWDAALLAGDRFEDEIASVLRTSRTVIVLWSRKSVGSDWVKAEAESARAQKKVLPAVIDDLPMDELPLLFRGVHTVRLGGWAGEDAHAGYTELMESVADRLGAAPGPSLTAPQAEAKLAQNVGEAEVWSAIAASADPSAAEYRAYLKQFGPSARFAELAQIRIDRLEEREKEGAGKVQRLRRKWAPAIVLPLIALAIIAGAAGWMWQRGDLGWLRDYFIPEEIKDKATACANWSKRSNLEAVTTFPAMEDGIVNACEVAEETWPDKADYKAMLAMVRVVQGQRKADDAIRLARQSIDAGSALGNYVLGVMYNYHLNLTEDFDKAASYYQEAYKLGYADAAGRLCYMAEQEHLTLRYAATPSEIFDLCSEASDKGSAIGQAMLGYIYEYGQFGKAYDDTKAVELYEKSAAQGYPFAKIQLGSVLLRGTGIQRDPARAASLFEEARALGYPEAMRWLAILHESGTGVAQDIPRAGQLYYEAINRRDRVASFLLGFRLTQNMIFDDFDGRELNRLASEVTPLGDRILGVLRLYGVNMPQSDSAAFASFNQCADVSALCQFVLASFLRFGPEQYVDFARAAVLMQQAADAGEMHAQFELARFYEYGEGVPVDLAKARQFYQLALAQGFQAAGDDLYRLGQGTSVPAQ